MKKKHVVISDWPRWHIQIAMVCPQFKYNYLNIMYDKEKYKILNFCCSSLFFFIILLNVTYHCQPVRLSTHGQWQKQIDSVESGLLIEKVKTLNITAVLSLTLFCFHNQWEETSNKWWMKRLKPNTYLHFVSFSLLVLSPEEQLPSHHC